MEFLLIILAAAAVVWFLIPKNKKSKDHPSSTHVPLTINTNTPIKQDAWHSVDLDWGKKYRPVGIVAMQGGTDIGVKGVAKRPEAIALIKKQIGSKMPVALEREPDNKFDENAVAVKCGNTMLGYLPTDLAGDIAAQFSTDMPLAAEARRCGWKEDTAFIAINVLVPAAKDRKKYEI
ncbi:HIRAN domain-containing protein [Ruegeria sp. 2205SS24-7]|uniref:HIRAN domain-containing protein n=1 Tax=Ruegeria discodermiae TaxID=3064389 RepID=UPI002742679A|nr:HIRAN domain-containing protein [Ruegeria sp. 2205SS24-7]MDP5220237.1 HIRAN domain-containing protein [Ruegeria sp. 2205SS24-7]